MHGLTIREAHGSQSRHLPDPSANRGIIIQFLQAGTDVTATAIGAKGSTANLTASSGNFSLGASGSISGFSGLTGPAEFGPGTFTNTSNTSGQSFQLAGSLGRIFAPSSFLSGGAISSEAPFFNRTLANLGLTTGQYVQAAPFDTITVDVGPFEASPFIVPEPATWAMLIGGLCMVGSALRTTRRKEKTSHTCG